MFGTSLTRSLATLRDNFGGQNTRNLAPWVLNYPPNYSKAVWIYHLVSPKALFSNRLLLLGTFGDFYPQNCHFGFIWGINRGFDPHLLQKVETNVVQVELLL